MSKSVVAAYNAYPLTNENKYNKEINAKRLGFQQGYEQAEKEYKNQWISVEETLPEEEYKLVFVRIEFDEDTIVFDSDYIRNNEWELYKNSNITHWMPIPSMEGGEE